MKRLISLTMVVMLLMCMTQVVPVFAVPGEDAHSDTMTVEADGDTVQEKQAEETEVVDKELSEEEVQEQLGSTDQGEQTETEEVVTANRISPVALVGSILVLVLVVIAMVVDRRRRRDNYHSRH